MPRRGRAAGAPEPLARGEPPPCRATSGARTPAARRRSRRSGASSSISRTRRPRSPKHVVTVSPDVASSTNLGGWINRVGVWNIGDRIDWFADDTRHAGALARVRARPAHRARHRRGQPRRPARRARRDLVARRPAAAADRRRSTTRSSTARSSRGRSGCTPAASRSSSARRPASRSRPRAARTSRSSRRRSGSSSRAASPGSRRSGRTSSGRCSTRSGSLGTAGRHLGVLPPQHAARSTRRSPRLPADPAAREERRRGRCSPAATCCARRPARPPSTLVGMGAVMPEVLAAADELAAAGIAADVVCLTSADLVFRAAAGAPGAARPATTRSSTRCFPPSARAPIVTVLDGHPHTLAFLAAVRGTPIASLGRRTSASPATSTTSTATSASTPTRSSAPPRTSPAEGHGRSALPRVGRAAELELLIEDP